MSGDVEAAEDLYAADDAGGDGRRKTGLAVEVLDFNGPITIIYLAVEVVQHHE